MILYLKLWVLLVIVMYILQYFLDKNRNISIQALLRNSAILFSVYHFSIH